MKIMTLSISLTFFFLASLLLLSSDFRPLPFLLLVILCMILSPSYSTFIAFLLLLLFSFSQFSLTFLLLRFIHISFFLYFIVLSHLLFSPSSFICFIQPNSSFTPLLLLFVLFFLLLTLFVLPPHFHTHLFLHHFILLSSLLYSSFSVLPSLFFLSLISIPPSSLSFFLSSFFSRSLICRVLHDLAKQFE